MATAAQVGVYVAAGAVSGAVNAAITGGNVGQGALIGGLSAGTSKYFGGDIGARIGVGSAAGGLASAMSEGDFAQGAFQGAWTSAVALVCEEVIKGAITKPGAKKIPGVKVYRKEIDIGGSDKYGHWWIEIDGAESYGWWPKDTVDLGGTLFGVEGELNGQTQFGGSATLDPHHGDRVGVDVYDVYGIQAKTESVMICCMISMVECAHFGVMG